MNETLRILQRRLLADRNADDGWSYLPRRRSRIEPTAWAVLALGDEVPRSRDLLAQWPRDGGLLVDTPGGRVTPAYSALAAVTLAASTDTQPVAAEIVGALLALGGVTWQRRGADSPDPSLRGWPWYPDTFSWVEPTALGLIAMKRLRRLGFTADAEARIAEGEVLLRDRVCANGGWNYGNSVSFGQPLEADVPTTAVGLIALQDRGRDDVVARSLQWLERRALIEPSTMGLGLAVVAAATLGRPKDALLSELGRLVQREDENVNLAGLATAAYALDWERHAFDAFRL